VEYDVDVHAFAPPLVLIPIQYALKESRPSRATWTVTDVSSRLSSLGQSGFVTHTLFSDSALLLAPLRQSLPRVTDATDDMSAENVEAEPERGVADMEVLVPAKGEIARLARDASVKANTDAYCAFGVDGLVDTRRFESLDDCIDRLAPWHAMCGPEDQTFATSSASKVETTNRGPSGAKESHQDAWRRETCVFVHTATSFSRRARDAIAESMSDKAREENEDTLVKSALCEHARRNAYSERIERQLLNSRLHSCERQISTLRQRIEVEVVAERQPQAGGGHFGDASAPEALRITSTDEPSDA